MNRRLLVLVSAGVLGIPARVGAQDPQPSTETPAPPPSDAPPSDAPPTEPAPAQIDLDEAPSGEAPTREPMPSEASYEAFAASLPDDYDIDYRWVPPDKTRVKKAPREGRQRTPRDSSISSEAAGRMRVAGGTLLGLGIATTVLSVSIGVPIALTEHGDTADGARLAAIVGGSIGGAAFLVGTGLLVGGRKAAREHGDLPPKDKPFMPLSAKQKSNHTVAAVLGLLYGAGGLGGGLGLMLCDCSDSKQNAGKVLVALGSISMAVGTYAAIRLGVDKVRSKNGTTRLQTSPMFVHGGGGAQLGLRW